jgi:hypothetical protein
MTGRAATSSLDQDAWPGKAGQGMKCVLSSSAAREIGICMKHHFTLMALLLTPLAVLHAADPPKPPPGKPNILVIVADDLGYGDIGVHGGKDVPTPNIDALAAGGVRCTSGYVSAPYCSPSRAGFLTGRYQTRFGHEFNPHVGEATKLGLPLDQRTIADRLRGAGYATGLVGKWHQGFSSRHHPQSRGFDDYYGFLVAGHNYLLHKDAEARFGSAHSHDMIYRNRELQKLDGYTTDLFTDESLAFMDRHARRPWFLYLAYNAVHTPLEVLEKNGARVRKAERAMAHSCRRVPPTPSGSFTLWRGPATNPSSEMEILNRSLDKAFPSRIGVSRHFRGVPAGRLASRLTRWKEKRPAAGGSCWPS